MLQPYKTLDHLVRAHRVLLPSPKETWRLVVDPIVGSINGLGNLRGGTVATNGIMVALLDELNTLRFGHLGWFVPDETEKNVEMSDLWLDAKVETVQTRKKSKLDKTLADYLDW